MLSNLEVRVIDFAFNRILTGRPQFYARDLSEFVEKKYPGIAPGTPCRLLRRLRWTNHIGYKLINRNESLYQMMWV